jgi:hypothetical protein
MRPQPLGTVVVRCSGAVPSTTGGRPPCGGARSTTAGEKDNENVRNWITPTAVLRLSDGLIEHRVLDEAVIVLRRPDR